MVWCVISLKRQLDGFAGQDEICGLVIGSPCFICFYKYFRTGLPTVMAAPTEKQRTGHQTLEQSLFARYNSHLKHGQDQSAGF